jgi:hypothetical protein
MKEDSSVDIMAICGMDYWISMSGSGRYFSLFRHVQNGFGAYPASYLNGYMRLLSSEVKRPQHEAEESTRHHLGKLQISASRQEVVSESAGKLPLYSLGHLYY